MTTGASGALAEAMLKAVREAPNHKGDMTAADLTGYRVKERDPVCLMSIDPARAAGKAEYGGHTYYFCSRYCRARFEADPALYAR